MSFTRSGEWKHDAERYDALEEHQDDDWLSALALIYIAAPSVIMLLAFTSWPLAAATALASFIVIYLGRALLRSIPPVSSLLRYWPLLAVACAATWTIGVLPPFAQNGDWAKHYAVFNVLVGNKWPALIEKEGISEFFRYSASLYILPSILGNILSKAFMPFAIFTWTTLGVFLLLLLAFRDIRPWYSLFLAALIFFSFSGLDILGTWVTGHQMGPIWHWEWWAA